MSSLLVLLVVNSVFASSLSEIPLSDPGNQSTPSPVLPPLIFGSPQFILPEDLGGTLGGFLNEVNKVENLYNQAYKKYNNKNYFSALVDLENIIEQLVDPEYSVWSEDESPDLGDSIQRGGEWIGNTIRRILKPVIEDISELLFDEELSMDYEDYEVRQQLEEGIERTHRIAAQSLRLLQQTLVAQYRGYDFSASRAENALKALKVAELARQLEFIRLKPILTHSDLPTSAIIPGRLKTRDIRRISKKQDATIVYYSVVAPEEIFIWVIQPTGEIELRRSQLTASGGSLKEAIDYALEVASRFIDRGRVDKSLIQAIRDLRSPDINDYPDPKDFVVNASEQQEGLQRLYQILVAPIEDLLPTDPNSHVVFVPQGVLFSVPFAALRNNLGHYLIEQHTVRIAVSLSSLEHIEPRLKNFPDGEDMLIVGNPTMPTIQTDESQSMQQLADLPGAEVEALTLAEMFQTHAITKDQASETAVLQKMLNAKAIHLATHGILDSRNPSTDFVGHAIEEAYSSQWATDYLNKLVTLLLPGAIALAKSNDTDGLLTSQEFLSLHLNADLAVLSACNTARGIPGDSTVLGLPFSLGVSGISHVVVSLWSVPDAPTKDLMIEFYRVIQEYDQQGERIDIAKALRAAMLSVKQNQEYPDPINWAAFTMIEIPPRDD